MNRLPKNIIIAGVPRSGKTTLGKRLCAGEGYSLFPVDASYQRWAVSIHSIDQLVREHASCG